jgi:hypothetical protein
VTPGWLQAAVAAIATVAIAVVPLTPALPPRDALSARVLCALMAVGACAGVAFARNVKGIISAAIVVVAAGGAIGMLLQHVDAVSTCVADYPGGARIIGREFTPDGAAYVRTTGTVSPSDLLLDVAGNPERLWTGPSIARCRFWVGWGGLLPIALLAGCVAVIVARPRFRYGPRSGGAPIAPTATPVTPVYDAFLSYRHTEPDKTYALQVLEALESRGLRAAIDIRDFRPNEHFVTEMERCVTQSRFVLCVITARYVDSDHCVEEVIITKTIDLAERSRRVVPLKFEPVVLPVWLHGLVGIDFTASADVEPVERLLALVQPHAGAGEHRARADA